MADLRSSQRRPCRTGDQLEKVHLISGLPRSGSTLLAAIFRQNPRFHAAVTSPVASLFSAVLPRMSGTSEFASFFSDADRHRILHGIFDSYYLNDGRNREVIFDTNRSWSARLPLVGALFAGARVICLVREVSWVLDSVERLVRRYPASVSTLFNYETAKTVYGRVNALMEPEAGLVGLAWSSLREAWFGEHAGKLLVVRYDSLCQQPDATVRRIYDELAEPYYPHDFANLEYDEADYDRRIGLPELHKVRRGVEFLQRRSVLPPDIFDKYARVNFWMSEKLNTNNVVVL
jgi:sulfotransferase